MDYLQMKRVRDRILSRNSTHLQIEQYTETLYQFVCPKCPGSPGMVPINGIKAEALQALFYRSNPLGLGFIEVAMKPNLSLREAHDLLAETTRFDYLHGRVMKVDFSGDEFDPRLYDRDNGIGAASLAVAEIRLHPADTRSRDYVFSIWSETEVTEAKCPRCKA
jgi:hypothetical protein